MLYRFFEILPGLLSAVYLSLPYNSQFFFVRAPLSNYYLYSHLIGPAWAMSFR